MRKFSPVFLMLLLLAVVVSGTGCATTDDERADVSERPWNTPKTWETGLPPGMMNPRY